MCLESRLRKRFFAELAAIRFFRSITTSLGISVGIDIVILLAISVDYTRRLRGRQRGPEGWRRARVARGWRIRMVRELVERKRC